MFGARRLLWATVLLTFTLLEIPALPATTSAPHTTHIVSYVHQGRARTRSGKISEFDYERIQNESSGQSAAIRSTEPPTPITTFYDSFVEQLDTTLNNGFLNTNNTPVVDISTTKSVNRTDDLLVTQQNTLDDANDVFGRNEQHESSTTVKNDSHSHGNGLMWNRMKQSIPVLEPVRHLLNTVRDQHNQTVHAAREHHQLLAKMKGGGLGDHMAVNESSAIETEADRETANESTEFKLLDFAGSLVGMLWGFIGNLQRIFAASSGNAFASSSSSSSGEQ